MGVGVVGRGVGDVGRGWGWILLRGLDTLGRFSAIFLQDR